ncbi:MAG: DEAD/DEAH box helicase [Algicola sp.]|nr:DEAD/DEAH box helicase [Algicola sp.]
MTDIQEQAIPLAMTGRDLIASSKTGSGKTLAFLIPAMQRLLTTRALSKKDARVLILAPTRELTKQVFAQLRSLLGNTPFKAQLILGGENFNDQAKALNKRPNIIVATPGRLADHLEQRNLDLAGLELLILDEADRMLDLGFAAQLKAINDIANHRKRQTLMFSATLDHAQVNQFATGLLKEPQRVAVGQAIDLHEDIDQQLYLCDHLDHKQSLLMHFLQNEDNQQVIVFTATRADTERLATEIGEKGISTTALSGDLSQSQRNKIMDGFSRGLKKILITTDIASRGLDLLNVSHVINFDMPKNPEEYIHRIGRTGRAGASGTAISLVGPKDWFSFKAIEAFLKRTLEFGQVEGLVGKFKGMAPPKPKAAIKKNIEKAKGKQKAAKAKKGKRNKGYFEGVEGGFGPVLKRKPRPESESESESEPEVE